MTTHTDTNRRTSSEKNLKTEQLLHTGKAEVHSKQVGNVGTQAHSPPRIPHSAGDPQSEGNSTQNTSEEQRI